jgi:hypothetical protein
MGFVLVPPTAGKVIVDDPVVPPLPVITQDVVPMMPQVSLVSFSVVNVPAAAAVPPIAGGEARYVEKPVPLTVLDALSVENAPVEAVVLPIGPGAANVAPPSVLALFVPVPLKVSEEPEPSTAAMPVFVPEVIAEKAGDCTEVSVTPESCTACPPAPVMTSPLMLLAA